MFNRIFLLATSLMLSSCGGDSVSFSEDVVLTGVFIDSPVVGLQYSSNSLNGLTGNEGEFSFMDGELVTFRVGGIVLGTALGAEVITPLDLVGVDSELNPAVVNIVRFLQTLDDDNDPDNGIHITEDVIEKAEGLNLDFYSSVREFEVNSRSVIYELTNVTNMGEQSLVSEVSALSHLRTSLGIELTPSSARNEDGFIVGGKPISNEEFISEVVGGTYLVDENFLNTVRGPFSLDGVDVLEAEFDFRFFDVVTIGYGTTNLREVEYCSDHNGLAVRQLVPERTSSADCNEIEVSAISQDGGGLRLDRFCKGKLDTQTVFIRLANSEALDFGSVTLNYSPFNIQDSKLMACGNIRDTATRIKLLGSEPPGTPADPDDEINRVHFILKFYVDGVPVALQFTFNETNEIGDVLAGSYVFNHQIESNVIVSAGSELFLSEENRSSSIIAQDAIITIDSFSRNFVSGSFDIILITGSILGGTFHVNIP